MTEIKPQRIVLQCPGCLRPSDSIKRFTMPDLFVFLWIFAWWRRATYSLCPSCMRKKIAEKMAINIIPANLIWPFLAVFWLVLLARTFPKGHSKSLLKLISH
ncbi:MAG: hypothetical protein ACLP8A_12000 [Methylovirgula sp.]